MNNKYSPLAGLSSELKTRKELSTLLSVVIFTCTVQHAATNNGQVHKLTHKYIYGHAPKHTRLWFKWTLMFCADW